MLLIERSQVGRCIGQGAYKKAFVFKPNPSKIVVVACNYGMAPGNQYLSLNYELIRLKRLRSLGFPVATTSSIVQVQSNSNKLYFGIVMPRYLASTNDASDKTDRIFLKTLNQKTIRDAKRMRDIAIENRVDVHDFQCLIKDDGGLVVHDPLRIIQRRPYSVTLELDTIIRLAQFCIDHRDKKVRHYGNYCIHQQALHWERDSRR